jgi:hypothetical protein
MLASSTIGTQVTLTCAAIAAPTDIDFRDIKLAGAFGAPLTGTRLGNCRGNDETTITFVAGVAKYWNLAAGGNWNAAAWALSSGGAVATTNFPLAQDSIVIEDTGLTAGNTITLNANYNIPTLGFSTRTLAMTFATGTTTPTLYGNLTLDANVTYTGTGVLTFAGRITQNLTSAGKTLTQPININSPSGIIELVDNLTLGATLTTTLTAGTLPAAAGGTGLTTPGTAGNVLTSTGSAWVSSTPAPGAQYFGTAAVKAIAYNASNIDENSILFDALSSIMDFEQKYLNKYSNEGNSLLDQSIFDEYKKYLKNKFGISF